MDRVEGQGEQNNTNMNRPPLDDNKETGKYGLVAAVGEDKITTASDPTMEKNKEINSPDVQRKENENISHSNPIQNLLQKIKELFT